MKLGPTLTALKREVDRGGERVTLVEFDAECFRAFVAEIGNLPRFPECFEGIDIGLSANPEVPPPRHLRVARERPDGSEYWCEPVMVGLAGGIS